MEGFWASWLIVGLVLAIAGVALRMLEAALWNTSPARVAQWLPSRNFGECSSPRDGLLAVFIMGGALLRGAAWYALWVAGMQAGEQIAEPSWMWVLLFLVPTLLVEATLGVMLSRRPCSWESVLAMSSRFMAPMICPVLDKLRPKMTSVAQRLFPWSFALRVPPGPEEAETLLRMREEEGFLTLPEAEILTEVFRLSCATVDHYMTPRVDVVFAEDSMSNAEVRALLLKHNFVRVPVIGETPDEVVGLLDRRTLGRLPEGMRFIEALLPPSFVPESMDASELLGSFLKRRQPLAVVLDEFGGVEGVVTLEDFVDKILADAVPKVGAELYIERLGDEGLLASGMAQMDDLSEHLGFDARQEGIETIGGYVVNQLGRFPQAGASVRLGPWKVTVRSMGQKRVREVTLYRVQQEEGK